MFRNLKKFEFPLKTYTFFLKVWQHIKVQPEDASISPKNSPQDAPP